MYTENIIDLLGHNEYGCDKNIIIEENIKGKNIDDIKEYLNQNIKNLIDMRPDEIGGLTAVTGFYYQFLVTIEYLIEMYEGKWDCIAVELHDDIVAIKENKIRFIQVKTSKHPASPITENPARELYDRSSKKDGSNENKSLNNCWIDKLIDKSKYFKDDNDVCLEFELITSFNIINTRAFNIDNYRNREKVIQKQDHIYLKLKEDSYRYCNSDKVYKLVDYEDLYGKKLEELLSKFYLNEKGDNIGRIDKYINHICKRLEICIGKNISISKDDVDWIIGKICSMCNISSKGYTLIIDKELLNKILIDIESKAIDRVENELECRGTKTIINRIYKNIHEEFVELDYYNKIEQELLIYKECLIEWINKNGGIKLFINRYLSGSRYSNKFESISDTRRDNVIKEILIMPIILEIIYNTKNRYLDNSSLLIKKIENSKNSHISLLGLEKGTGKFKDKQLDDLKNILNQLEDDEILKLCVSDKLNIVLQGYKDSNFKELITIEIKEKLDLQGNKKFNELLMDTEDSLNKVDMVANILPGEAIRDYLNDVLDSDEWNPSKIEQFWNEIIRG